MTENELMQAIIADLGANYAQDDDVLGALIDDVIVNALSITNRYGRVLTGGELDYTKLSTQLPFIVPEVKKAVKTLYLQRGAEDVRSQSLSGISSTYDDAMATLRRDLIMNGKRVLV